jgi:hypothetical protein
MERGARKRRRRSERASAALFAEDRRPALSRQVHWQNYGYHGCGERGKQKDVSRFNASSKAKSHGGLCAAKCA